MQKPSLLEPCQYSWFSKQMKTRYPVNSWQFLVFIIFMKNRDQIIQKHFLCIISGPYSLISALVIYIDSSKVGKDATIAPPINAPYFLCFSAFTLIKDLLSVADTMWWETPQAPLIVIYVGYAHVS